MKEDSFAGATSLNDKGNGSLGSPSGADIALRRVAPPSFAANRFSRRNIRRCKERGASDPSCYGYEVSHDSLMFSSGLHQSCHWFGINRCITTRHPHSDPKEQNG